MDAAATPASMLLAMATGLAAGAAAGALSAAHFARIAELQPAPGR